MSGVLGALLLQAALESRFCMRVGGRGGCTVGYWLPQGAGGIGRVVAAGLSDSPAEGLVAGDSRSTSVLRRGHVGRLLLAFRAWRAEPLDAATHPAAPTPLRAGYMSHLAAS